MVAVVEVTLSRWLEVSVFQGRLIARAQSLLLMSLSHFANPGVSYDSDLISRAFTLED